MKNGNNSLTFCEFWQLCKSLHNFLKDSKFFEVIFKWPFFAHLRRPNISIYHVPPSKNNGVTSYLFLGLQGRSRISLIKSCNYMLWTFHSQSFVFQFLLMSTHFIFSFPWLSGHRGKRWSELYQRSSDIFSPYENQMDHTLPTFWPFCLNKDQHFPLSLIRL